MRGRVADAVAQAAGELAAAGVAAPRVDAELLAANVLCVPRGRLAGVDGFPAEQERRFRDRLKDPLKQWKLSPMDLESLTRWEEYSRAKDDMFAATDNPDIPWMVVESEDKRRARLNMIAHLLASVPWQPVERPELRLPKRPKPTGYVRPPRELFHEVPDHAATLG